MSSLIKAISEGSKVYIGERHFDEKKETQSFQKLAQLFPGISILTDNQGAKLIPIHEAFKMEIILNEKIDAAFKKGYEKGSEAGLKEGLKKSEEVLSKFDKAISDAINQRASLLDEARENVLKLVIQISKKVTFEAIEIDPEKTLKMINEVINTLIDRSRLKIKVNPKHLPIVEQNIDMFLKNSTSIKELKIEPDPRVQFGGCFIETPTGDIDARLDSQFEVIEEVLRFSEDK